MTEVAAIDKAPAPATDQEPPRPGAVPRGSSQLGGPALFDRDTAPKFLEKWESEDDATEHDCA